MCPLAAVHVPAEAPQLSCFNGKEPFGPLRSFSALLTVPAGRFLELSFFSAKEPLGHLRSFSALLEVPAGRSSCASGRSSAHSFHWQRALLSPKVLLLARKKGALITTENDIRWSKGSCSIITRLD